MIAYFILAFIAVAAAKPHHPIKLGKRCANLFDESCANGGLPGANGDEEWLGGNTPGKRCANLFDESCNNGGLPGASDDEEWLGGNTPGKRCANLFDESCNNGGLPGASDDEEWLGGNTPGKRNAQFNAPQQSASRKNFKLAELMHRMHLVATKRCANLFDESCMNGNLAGSNGDSQWLGGNTPGKRCANLFDESCNNGGLPGASDDEEWLGGNTPGKRNAQSASRKNFQLADLFHRMHMVATKRCANLFDESCMNGNLAGSNGDAEWLGGNNPGKRCANLFDESCNNGGLPGASDDEEWLGGNTPGKRWTGKLFG